MRRRFCGIRCPQESRISDRHGPEPAAPGSTANFPLNCRISNPPHDEWPHNVSESHCKRRRGVVSGKSTPNHLKRMFRPCVGQKLAFANFRIFLTAAAFRVVARIHVWILRHHGVIRPPPSWPLFILRTDQAGFSFEPTSDQPQARLIAHNTGSGARSTEGRKITVEARNGPLRAEKAVRASQTRLAVLKARNTPFLHLANRAESSPTRGIVRRRFRRKGSRIRAGRRNRGEGGSGGRVC